MSKFAPRKSADEARPIKESFTDGAAPTKALNANIDADLHRRLKLLSVTKEISMRAILEEALAAYLDKQE